MKKKPEGLSIVQLAPPQDTGLGDYTYRVESPGRAMSALKEVRTVVSITGLHRDRESLIRECDILLLQHVCDPDLLPVIAERREQGLVTVFEIGDNIEHVQPWNMTFGFWQNEENRSLMCRLIFSCDGFQANNGELLKAFGHLNGTQALFPNHLAELPPEREGRPGPGNDLVIGWGGSHGHIEDIRSIAPALIPWLRSNRRVRLALMASDAILEIFADLPAEQKLFRGPGTIRDYYDFLQTIDIGLAPLQDTPYNRCRSDVKFVEYAAFGALPLLQDLAPYREPSIPGGTRYLFRDPRELPHILDQLLSRTELRKQICGRARTYVAENRLENRHARERIRFYRDLLRTKVSPGKKEALRALRGYVPYTGTAFEQNLYNGLVYLETRERPDAARGHFLEAEKRIPGHYLPPLFLSRCSGDPIGDLHRSLERNPRGLKARMLLGEAYAQKGDAASALGVYREAIEGCPGYDLPYRRAAELLSRLNMKKEAESLARSAADLDLRKKSPAAVSPVSPEVSSSPGVNGASLYLVMPRGMNYGWGICGKYLAREISALTNIRYVTEPFTAEDIGDELDEMLLRGLCLPQDEVERLVSAAQGRPLDVPVIQAIQGGNLLPWGPQIPSTWRIGYTFFEDNILSPRSIRSGDEHFDVVVAGSRWCEEVLQSYGLRKTRTIIQGVDPAIFHPRKADKDYFKDRFVIFSGGKFELRKGQDLVLRAFRHLAQKYDDVLLVISWFNAWPASMNSMSASPYIRFETPNGDYPGFIRRLLTANGIAPEKVLSLPPKPNAMMARIYGNTDIGLFPNRCEGGTNLVLMEYMACGKPVIASFSSGHRDILSDGNALVLRKMKKMNLLRDGAPTAVWDDPDLDEVVEKLEWAYLNRGKLAPIARQAGEDLARLTWAESAKQFYDLAHECSTGARKAYSGER